MRTRTSTAVRVAVALLLTGTATGVAAGSASAAPTGAEHVPALTAAPLPPGRGMLFDTLQAGPHTTWAFGAWKKWDGKVARDTPVLLADDDRDARGWREVPLPAVPGGNQINAAAVVPGSGGRDAWLAGLSHESLGGILTEHWNGTSWQVVTIPLPDKGLGAYGGLTSVTARAADDVWAVGWAQVIDSRTPDPRPEKPGGWIIEDHFEALTEHWDGHSWQRVDAPDGLDYLPNGVAVAGPDDVWTAGYDSDDIPTAQHWDGHTWTSEPLPSTGWAGEVYQLAAGPRGELWAVGRSVLDEDDTGHALVLRRVGGHWRQVPVPASAGPLDSVTLSPGGITVAGREVGGENGYAMRLEGGRWTRFVLPAAEGSVFSFAGVSVSPAHGVTLVGTSMQDGRYEAAVPLVLRAR